MVIRRKTKGKTIYKTYT